ncbi:MULTISPECIES: Fe-S cluster assembly sulfur transfer protein SufU [unclassified Paraburkholderia]|uniref:Fe-S cluster assembly sulfur transfer protein SufU n=1 Tax=unclassified Paraburkholderia TaxID=2615204 RepID=UPI0016076BCF|nr:MULTISPECIES: SUF system NifU family Fe-S cluster assembly protein [unclassified Paraburkholderia]MBB5407515.1 nitrogen fixation NifU-like protein [Paraburkholderia sp. HC6.4b]MBB5453728.1 nitrogen fixation NifU-like protein [Paraburkholderia sp. Kb1A]MBC8722957.1 SUF system NifU family Fe-S cluster assembly protein [Paraburkholderia sp. 31.1]MBC8727730.1 SUF system NifU family Fe-S cluster assembly protein [Paraburkholderia sp. UCT2]
MSDLRDLYQEVIFDHYRRPRNCHGLSGANHTAEGYNPLCGDRITLYLRIEDGIVKEASFEGAGCAIATASASLMTEALKGKTEAEAEALFGRFHDMVTTPAAGQATAAPEMGKLAVLSGVREFPERVKCATLAWHTLHAALHDEDRPVSTE